jgi:hypothetical protein
MIKRAVMDQDINLVLPWLQRRRPVVNIQKMVIGHDATMAVACWRGRVVAALSFDVVHVWEARGPASVLRLKENPEMEQAAARMVERLGLSGLYGFDFMIEDETNAAYLIEMNPRATQSCHLTLGPGRDIPAALWSAVTGNPLPETPSITSKETIALFPQEWQRNPVSPFLVTAYHDVPWTEPELVRACIANRPVRWPGFARITSGVGLYQPRA